MAIALLSIGVLALTDNPGLSGVVYFLMAPAHTAAGFLISARAEKIKNRLDSRA